MSVAIKEIDLEKAHIKEVDCINSEIKILRKLDHPNIVRLRGSHKINKRIFLVLDHCAGGDLNE